MGGETPGSRATASTSTHRFLLPEKGFYTEPFCFQGKCFKFWASRHGPRTAAIKEGRKRASPQGAAALRTELAASGPQRKSRPSPGREARVAFTAHAELLPPIDFFFFSQKPLFSRTLGVFRESIASEFTCLSDSGPPLPGREGAHPLQGLLLPHLRLARPCRLTPLRPRLQDRRPKPSRAGPSLCGRMGPSAPPTRAWAGSWLLRRLPGARAAGRLGGSAVEVSPGLSSRRLPSRSSPPERVDGSSRCSQPACIPPKSAPL